ncbi:hypothetical protein [Gymnodinialimonas sp. 57CJ19]|uniref:hypothetical protein n=1 Tax=Gymnodinialimonas sp. 57CJ19 TaxID=3138498 RepID=UPI0031344FD4
MLSQEDTQNFVLSNGFADAPETQWPVGALIAAGAARTEGANLILESPNCANGAAQATPQPVPVPVPTPQPAPAPQPVPEQAPQPVPVSVLQTANACPTFEQMGQTYSMTGDQLYSPHSLTLQAGGSTDISGCNVGGVGFANAVPHLSIGLSGMETYGRLEVEVDAQCDTTLLVNTPTAQWVFDDDSGGNLQPLLNLPSSAALNGRLDIWVGTYNGAACAATIELETWNG